MNTMSLLPHRERLLRRIRLLETPLVHVWGWPGSGRSGLLQALVETDPDEARGLSLGELEDGAALRTAMDEARGQGIRWLVALGAPEERLAEAAHRLHPGQRLIFASDRRWQDAPLPISVVPPQEMLLTATEVAALWELVTGEIPGPSSAQSLCAAGDGWYQPLRLALESTGGAGLDTAGPEDLLDLAPVRYFLRHEVLEALCPLPDELPAERPAAGEGGREAWRIVDARGYWVEGEERDRLPALLAAALERERRRRQSSAERRIARAPVAPPCEPGAVPAFTLGLLGSPVARRRDPDGTETELDCRLRRSFQLLAYLASSAGFQAGRDELMEAVWPVEGERTIERNFHPTLSHLRRALEAGRKDDIPPLLSRQGIYRLNPDLCWEVDALDLDRLAQEARERSESGDLTAAVAAWEAAWHLYRGPFLPGHYEAWVTERRERYQRLYLELLRDLGDAYLRLDLPEKAMDAYRSVLLEDPLQERVHVAVMRLYAAQGRRDLVRRQYDRLCALLRDELGVEPMPETQREFHRLME